MAEALRPGGTAEGHVDPGFEPLIEVFDANFRERKDNGSAFAAVVNGRRVVDLWGGTADSRHDRPWNGDTVSVLHSGTKGVVAIALRPSVLACMGLATTRMITIAFTPAFPTAS